MRNTRIDPSDERQVLSLRELNSLIRGTISSAFHEAYWVRAEMTDVRINAASGHCYLEFIEKHPQTGQLLAKTRGSIWARVFSRLKPYFESSTGQSFTSGLKVLVQANVEYHEVYGLSLNVIDIDPTYTIGDLRRRRMEILRQLQQEGILDLNKQLPLPLLPTRVAIITSPTAAGYEDFLHQLNDNPQRYPFYTQLFPAIMQGERTGSSIITALDQINAHLDLFDVVVIIRGGGATSDLTSFDSYALAANCAQFPLPIITGIGHERDDTVVDLVAHTRMKTPTAVAEFLIGRLDRVADYVEKIQQDLTRLATGLLTQYKGQLQLLTSRFPGMVTSRIERQRSELRTTAGRLPSLASGLLTRRAGELDGLQIRLQGGATALMSEATRFLQLTEQFVKMASPDYILRRGYSLTLRKGKIVKLAAELRSGDELTTRFADGEIKSIIK